MKFFDYTKNEETISPELEKFIKKIDQRLLRGLKISNMSVPDILIGGLEMNDDMLNIVLDSYRDSINKPVPITSFELLTYVLSIEDYILTNGYKNKFSKISFKYNNMNLVVTGWLYLYILLYSSYNRFLQFLQN